MKRYDRKCGEEIGRECEPSEFRAVWGVPESPGGWRGEVVLERSPSDPACWICNNGHDAEVPVLQTQEAQ